jgi:PTH1 family peptidyl-tRNA hydrolase
MLLDAEKKVFLVVGLGNPGREYRKTRHNAGFMVLDRLAERLGESFSRYEQRALVVSASTSKTSCLAKRKRKTIWTSNRALRYYQIGKIFLIVYDKLTCH